MPDPKKKPTLLDTIAKRTNETRRKAGQTMVDLLTRPSGYDPTKIPPPATPPTPHDVSGLSPSEMGAWIVRLAQGISDNMTNPLPGTPMARQDVGVPPQRQPLALPDWANAPMPPDTRAMPAHTTPTMSERIAAGRAKAGPAQLHFNGPQIDLSKLGAGGLAVIQQAMSQLFGDGGVDTLGMPSVWNTPQGAGPGPGPGAPSGPAAPAPPGTHRMPDGSIMANSAMPGGGNYANTQGEGFGASAIPQAAPARPTLPSQPVSPAVPTGYGEKPVFDSPLGPSAALGNQADLLNPTAPEHVPTAMDNAARMTGTAPAAPEASPASQAAERHDSIWRDILGSLPEFAVNFASAWLDKPDIAQNWLRQRELDVQKQVEQQRMEAAAAKDAWDRQLQLTNLNLNLANGRQNVLEHVKDLQKSVATGSIRDLQGYTKALAVYAQEFANYGGKPETIINSFPVPRVDVIRQLIADRDQYIKNVGAETAKWYQKAIVNPLWHDGMDPEDQMLSAVDISSMVGDIDPKTGRFTPPHGLIQDSFREVTTKDQAGTSTTRMVPKYITDQPGWSATSQTGPQAGRYTVLARTEDPASGKALMTVQDTGTGKISFLESPIAFGGPAATISNVESMGGDIAIQSEARSVLTAIEISHKGSDGRKVVDKAANVPPSPLDISMYLMNPENKAFIVKRLSGAK